MDFDNIIEVAENWKDESVDLDEIDEENGEVPEVAEQKKKDKKA